MTKKSVKIPNQMRQGEALFIEVDSIPEGLEEASPVNGNLIIAHSETGHHHVIDVSRISHKTGGSKTARHLIDKTNEFISYLEVNDNCEVKHLRDHDTHKSMPLEKGKKYQVRLRREYAPEGFRKVQD